MDKIKNLRFVYCALPDLDLASIKTEEEFDSAEGKFISLPLAVEVESNPPQREGFFYLKEKGEFFFVDKGKKKSIRRASSPILVKDGVDLAKCIRIGAEPCIIKSSEEGKIPSIREELRIAMFLTNSKDIEALKNAEIYVV
jgi:hypothetical protein